MVRTISFRKMALAVALTAVMFATTPADAVDTLVRFDTSQGAFDVQLFDDAAPVTVANFLTYVNRGDFDDTFFHRLMTDFVLQGGGFGLFPADTDLTIIADVADGSAICRIPTDPPIALEYQLLNAPGTIAMARTTVLDSATSQFFFNLEDNSEHLSNYGGYAVFGQILGTGVEEVVNSIDPNFVQDVADIDSDPNFVRDMSDLGPVWETLPMPGYTMDDPVQRENLFIIHSVTVVAPPAIPSDIERDGDVDVFDFMVLQENFNTLNRLAWELGDVDGDTDVDLADFQLLYAKGGWEAREEGSGGGVPEPATMCLLAVGAATLLRRPKA